MENSTAPKGTLCDLILEKVEKIRESIQAAEGAETEEGFKAHLRAAQGHVEAAIDDVRAWAATQGQAGSAASLPDPHSQPPR